MIQRCPECGQWCEVEKDGFISKASRGFNNAAVGGGTIGASIGSIFGKTGEKVGAALGGGAVGGSGLGFLNAAAESLFGDDYQFVCPTCGHEWSTDDPDDDQTEEYNLWLAEQERNEAIVELRDKYPSVIHASRQEQQEYIKELQHQLSYEDNTDAQSATLYDTIAAATAFVAAGSHLRIVQVGVHARVFVEEPHLELLNGTTGILLVAAQIPRQRQGGYP